MGRTVKLSSSNRMGSFLRYTCTMRLVQFEGGDRNGLGVELSDGGKIVDVSACDSSVPTNMRTFIEGGQEMIQKTLRAVNSGSNVLERNQVKLIAPILNPDKLICIGMNYVDHCKEQNLPVPTEPIVFSKFNSSIIGPTDDIPYPDET